MELVYGAGFIQNRIADKLFKFYANNYYPSLFESYANLNIKIAEMIRRTQNKEIVIELDAANGVLATLVNDCCEHFYPIVNYKHSVHGIDTNLKDNCLTSDYYTIRTSISKCYFHIKSILDKHGSDCRISLVFQNFDFNLYPPIRKMSIKILFVVEFYKSGDKLNIWLVFSLRTLPQIDFVLK